MISIAHKIEIKPNNKQKTFFRKAFGCSRIAWNWALAEWRYETEIGGKPTGYSLQKKFYSIKKEKFPFMYEVGKSVTGRIFIDLQNAFSNFFAHRASYPKFKKKKDNQGSFFIDGDRVVLCSFNKNSKKFKSQMNNQSQNHQYLKVPKLGYVKMTEKLRFEGKIINAVISQRGDKFFVSFSMMISEEEYIKTHPCMRNHSHRSVGIDVGIKSAIVLSDGISVSNPRFLTHSLRRLRRLQRRLSKRICVRTKLNDVVDVQKSNNFLKLSRYICNYCRDISFQRINFINKVSSIIVSNYDNIAIESLNVKGMMRNHILAGYIQDVSFYSILHQIQYKSEWTGKKIFRAGKMYASSKICSNCGNKIDNLALDDRVYHCTCCGYTIDRDLNAAKNLRGIIYNQLVGMDDPEFTPADLNDLLYAFERNQIAAVKVETGKRQKCFE